MKAITIQERQMTDPVTMVLLSILGTLGTVFGGQWAWRYFTKRDDNQSTVTLETQKHQVALEKDARKQIALEGTRVEKQMQDTIDRLDAQLQKHEARLKTLEDEKALNLSTIYRLESEGREKDNEIARLNGVIDTVIEVLEEHSVDEAIIRLLRG